MNNNPILNSPYEEPKLHYHTNDKGELDYESVQKGRRIFIPDIHVIPTRQGAQKEIFEVNDLAEEYGTHLVNLVRKEIGQWRDAGYPNTTRVTKELLNFWFNNPERHAIKKLFFAQRETVETAIWLNEVAERSNAGQNILNKVKASQKEVSNKDEFQLPRIAFKMATGTGKTVVMATLIVYHYFNRQEYRQDTRFADNFLIVAPGITIKDRLGVLFVDKKSSNKNQREDYYAIRDLVPRKLEPKLANINSKLVITNYHSFEARTLKGNKKSPFDGKIIRHDDKGKPIKQEAKEDTNQVIKRVLGNFKKGSRLLVLNDEAHHCYLPKEKGKTKDTEGDENAKAAVWFSGLAELKKEFKLTAVYDLSATPYYLQGSGYQPYSLFGWVVSDFGLIEAIESGLVKIPYLPESDNTQELTMPVLRNLYEHVKDELPRKGRRTQRKEAKEEGRKISEAPPKIPHLVKGALDQFYSHYKDYADNIREKGEAAVELFSRPPVFIAVCNNTAVSKEVYKFVAGYEYENEKGEINTVPGTYDLFSNYDQTGRLKRKSPTLLIDSEALDNADQVSSDFKKIFDAEIEEFKRDYARLKGQGAVENITDAEILREVVNTVGEPGKLGAHVKCVVSVSMLTEGWDANTVTHIMGLRAFGSQLLCEQVAGRALRRMNYFLQGYDKEGNPTSDKRKIVVEKFPPEYAHIIGVPFKMFKGGATTIADPPEYTHVQAIPSRQEEHEIEFPNIDGYRVEYSEDDLKYDFSDIENFEIDGSKFPTTTVMGTAFSGEEEELQVSQVLEKRKQEIIYLITKELIKFHFSDEDHNPNFQKFQKLKAIVDYWYNNKVLLLNIEDEKYKKLLYFQDPKTIADHISRGINPHFNNSEYIKPVFNYYNRFGSTKYVSGNTSKDVYATEKSHVNYVVMDSDWEGVCAKTLEEIEEVESYVKNQFLGHVVPYVKDGKDKMYYTDFLVRVRKKDGEMANLMIEITGMNRDKTEKKWFVENRWLPAVNAVREKYNYDEWHFIEIANDIRNMKNQLINKIRSL
ncbi:BPTD_3080 family restriction endonuclease [uncultured Salegentibacter sp.]|uniref:BPTD_3080 family restriction endonuclease n=1 Tax=uncultured Salegentibacter sp. TaxID=259320 RepID=UPI0025991EAF|nr:DEAD/DEAH box helicase family protein [uncultured Salegentibacter sp.]